MPLDMAVTSDGKTLYVAAFGSSKIGVFETSTLENDTFDPVSASANYIAVSGGGVSGLALDEARGLLYAMTRFDDAVKVIDLKTNQEITERLLPNPEPPAITQGRRMLYDATQFSGNGEASCASCHIFGDMDDLAWDLGNPDNAVTTSPIPINLGGLFPLLVFADATGLTTPLNGSNKPTDFHPMKGPFTTQTLRGLANSGAMHWRGDRSTGAYGTDPFERQRVVPELRSGVSELDRQPDAPSPGEMQSVRRFSTAGAAAAQSGPQSRQFSERVADERADVLFQAGRPSDGIVSAVLDQLVGQASFSCNGCHTLEPANGFFGTGGNQSFEELPQTVKIPQLRNAYAKIGMFGTPAVSFFQIADSGNMGDQVRGFGFTGDGSTDTLFRFLNAAVFVPTSNPDSRKIIRMPRGATWSSSCSRSIPISRRSWASRSR